MLFIMSLNFTERGIREIKDDPAAGVALQKTAASRASDGPRAALFVTETSRSVEELDACFVVRDASGQKLGYFYYEEESGRRSAAKLLTKDEAWLWYRHR
jgi:uncharacterized protein (DUF2164 family)